MIWAYLSISERCCKHSIKMWWVQRKSISIFSASAFNAKNPDILLFSIRWIHNCVLCLNETMSRTHLNVYNLFRAWSCLADSDIKNHQKWLFGNPLLSMNRSAKLWDSVLSITHRCHYVSHSLQHLSSWSHEPTDVQMKQTPTVFCFHLAKQSTKLTNA